jgi:hypothetical protein
MYFKETVVAYLKELFQHLFGEAEKAMKNSVTLVSSLTTVGTGYI